MKLLKQKTMMCNGSLFIVMARKRRGGTKTQPKTQKVGRNPFSKRQRKTQKRGRNPFYVDLKKKKRYQCHQRDDKKVSKNLSMCQRQRRQWPGINVSINSTKIKVGRKVITAGSSTKCMVSKMEPAIVASCNKKDNVKR